MAIWFRSKTAIFIYFLAISWQFCWNPKPRFYTFLGNFIFSFKSKNVIFTFFLAISISYQFQFLTNFMAISLQFKFFPIWFDLFQSIWSIFQFYSNLIRNFLIFSNLKRFLPIFSNSIQINQFLTVQDYSWSFLSIPAYYVYSWLFQIIPDFSWIFLNVFEILLNFIIILHKI